MLSRETLDEYRRMTNAERWLLTAQLIRENTPALLEGPADVVARRFELLRRQNDDRNRLIRECLGRMEQLGQTIRSPATSSLECSDAEFRRINCLYELESLNDNN